MEDSLAEQSSSPCGDQEEKKEGSGLRMVPLSTQHTLLHLEGIFPKCELKEKSAMVTTRRLAYLCKHKHVFNGLMLNQMFQNYKNLSGFGKQVSLPYYLADSHQCMHAHGRRQTQAIKLWFLLWLHILGSFFSATPERICDSNDQRAKESFDFVDKC